MLKINLFDFLIADAGSIVAGRATTRSLADLWME